MFIYGISLLLIEQKGHQPPLYYLAVDCALLSPSYSLIPSIIILRLFHMLGLSLVLSGVIVNAVGEGSGMGARDGVWWLLGY